LLTYDLNIQHFQGSSDENGNGRIHILLDPEVINSESGNNKDKNKAPEDQADVEIDEPAPEAADPSKDGS